MLPEPEILTAIHRMVERCRADALSCARRETRSGWAVMGERQVFEGYCLLLPDPVVPTSMPSRVASGAVSRRHGALGDAVLAATGAVRINYALFGNVEPALHAHVFPRRADEAPDIRTAQPWALDWQAAPQFSPASHGELQRRIASYLE